MREQLCICDSVSLHIRRFLLFRATKIVVFMCIEEVRITGCINI